MKFFKLLGDKKDKSREKNVKHAETPKERVLPQGSKQSSDGLKINHTATWLQSYKPLVHKKLTIILLENTDEVLKQSDVILKIVKATLKNGSDYICVINYGSDVKKEWTSSDNGSEGINFLYTTNIGAKACFYDALVELEKLVQEKYLVVTEKEYEKEMVNQIEVVGIGTCKDNCSKTSKEGGIESFYKVAKLMHVVTKYFCLNEDTFMAAAEIGFHSIGAISQVY